MGKAIFNRKSLLSQHLFSKKICLKTRNFKQGGQNQSKFRLNSMKQSGGNQFLCCLKKQIPNLIKITLLSFFCSILIVNQISVLMTFLKNRIRFQKALFKGKIGKFGKWCSEHKGKQQLLYLHCVKAETFPHLHNFGWHPHLIKSRYLALCKPSQGGGPTLS